MNTLCERKMVEKRNSERDEEIMKRQKREEEKGIEIKRLIEQERGRDTEIGERQADKRQNKPAPCTQTKAVAVTSI